MVEQQWRQPFADLAAATALEGVRRQLQEGGTHAFELALASTAAWLLSLPASAAVASSQPDPSRWHMRMQSDAGPVSVVTAPGTFDGRALAWPRRLTNYGQDSPAW